MDGSLDGICVGDLCTNVCRRGGARIDEDREGKKVSACVNIPLRVPNFLASELYFFAQELFTCTHLGLLFSLIPDCVNTLACKHNDDL